MVYLDLVTDKETLKILFHFYTLHQLRSISLDIDFQPHERNMSYGTFETCFSLKESCIIIFFPFMLLALFSYLAIFLLGPVHMSPLSEPANLAGQISCSGQMSPSIGIETFT